MSVANCEAPYSGSKTNDFNARGPTREPWWIPYAVARFLGGSDSSATTMPFMEFDEIHGYGQYPNLHFVVIWRWFWYLDHCEDVGPSELLIDDSSHRCYQSVVIRTESR